MIIPINFVIGAAVGAVTTYVLKDESAKQWVKDTGNKLKDGTGSFMASFKKQPEEGSESIAESGEVIEGRAEEVTDKASPATS